MPVDWHPAGVSDKGQEEKPGQGHPFGITKLGESDTHVFMPLAGCPLLVPSGRVPLSLRSAGPDQRNVCKKSLCKKSLLTRGLEQFTILAIAKIDRR